MAVRIISKRLNPKGVMLKLADGSVATGKVNLAQDEEAVSRVSELFTTVRDPFIVLFDATLAGQGGQVLVINKSHILWMSPLEE